MPAAIGLEAAEISHGNVLMLKDEVFGENFGGLAEVCEVFFDYFGVSMDFGDEVVRETLLLGVVDELST